MSWSQEDQDSMDNSYDSSTVGIGTNTNQSYGGGNETNYVNSYGIPVTERSTNFIDFTSDIFGASRPSVWDRITGNTEDRFLNNMDLEDPRTFDAFFSGRPLDAMRGPISGNNSVYNPIDGSTWSITDRNKASDFFGNALNIMANPMYSAVGLIDTARVQNDLTGEYGNFESTSGWLGSSRIADDETLAAERKRQEEDRIANADQNNNTRTPDNTGGLLNPDQGQDIPWWVLANAGLLAL